MDPKIARNRREHFTPNGDFGKLGELITDFAAGGKLLDRSDADARRAVATVFTTCMIKVRVMDKIKHKTLVDITEFPFDWEQSSPTLQGHSVSAFLKDFCRPGNQFKITLLDAIGPDSRKRVAAFCLQS
jgi:hypothetical protein